MFNSEAPFNEDSIYSIWNKFNTFNSILWQKAKQLIKMK